ncbi:MULTISPECIES: class I SAM-dependent methyltransferase [Rhodococcus]|uniref:class I SAM-dependent methyltransferase n=1 Tax=Rhodococcus TaxID=1827 RepID=UPI0027E290AC|nr:class I SAM-dependent methyltransferase [Rhodococcus qingshengii]
MNSSDWDARYSSVEHPWGSAPAAALSARFAELPPGRAVDLGCGNGRHARWLGDAGWTVNAVDFSSVAIELARSGGEDRSIDYTVADVRAWEPPGPVDLVAIGFPASTGRRVGCRHCRCRKLARTGWTAVVSRSCAR